MSQTAASSPPLPAGSNVVRVYVWEWPVRVTHWLNVFSIVVLAVTGVYLGYPFLIAAGPANQRFVMGVVKLVHFYAAIVFTLSVLARVLWMFLGNKYAHWDKFIPVRKRRWRGLLPTLRFYTFAQRKPPGFIGHNPLAGLIYSLVFLLFLLQIATGLAIYAASAHVDSPLRAFDFLVPLFGGLQLARYIHHIVMWLLIGFAAHHVWSATLMSVVEPTGTMESIFTGYKFVPREDLVYSGYRFVDRNTAEGG
ncbi:MAG TPA: Ni/Fe-hydrogenase, b-type cytochrome subunit [Thermoanaerobaculia bacterium]|nr:Ni/Fe-hydrogenase, b-type cytochrome subunit [Thermoanaerobaculia bacterium]